MAPVPEVGCTVGLYVLAANQEIEQQKVVEMVQEVLPEVFSTSINKETSLTSAYHSLSVEFEVDESDSGYSSFVEAVNEITEAKHEAYSALDGMPIVDSVPKLVQEFGVAVSATQKDLPKLRTIFGAMLYVEDQTKGPVTVVKEDHQTPISPCGIKDYTTCGLPCEEYTCPPGGINGICILCPCEFFRCLSIEKNINQTLRSVFGFPSTESQCLAFVMDTTGSMRHEIVAAENVIKSFISSEEKEPECYILTPFNDIDDKRFAPIESKSTMLKFIPKVMSTALYNTSHQS